MRRYEMVYIFDPALERAAVGEKLEAFHAVLGGEVAEIDHWGARRLAYPIRKSSSGYYVVVRVSAPPEALPEFERVVKLDQETLRYLVVIDEGLPTSGESILGAVRGDQGGEPESEDEADGEEPAAVEGVEAEGAEEEDGEPDGASEEGVAEEGEGADAGADADAEEGEGAGAGADPAAEASARADAEEGAGEGTDGEEETGEPPPPGPRAGPPEYVGVRGRGRRREGPPIVRLNYKDVATLSRFLNDQGKILPKRTTRVTARFQRELGTAVKRARFLALLPYIRHHGS